MDVVITSNVYSDDLWAEIRYENYYWAEVRWDSAREVFLATIFEPPLGADRYVFPLSDLQAALERAKKRLLEMGYGSPLAD